MPERAREPALLFAWVAVSTVAWVVPHPVVRLLLLELSWLIVVLALVIAMVTSVVRAVLRRRRGHAAEWRRVATDTMWAVIIVVAVVMGEVVSIAGVLQWLVLRRSIPHAVWWTVAGILGVVVVQSFARAFIAGIYTYIAVAGLVLGVLQWLVLRRSVSSSLWWIGISPVAWLAGTYAEMLVWGSIKDFGSGELGLLLGHIGTRGGGGLVFGLVTGSGLTWLLRNRRAVTPSADPR